MQISCLMLTFHARWPEHKEFPLQLGARGRPARMLGGVGLGLPAGEGHSRAERQFLVPCRDGPARGAWPLPSQQVATASLPRDKEDQLPEQAQSARGASTQKLQHFMHLQKITPTKLT